MLEALGEIEAVESSDNLAIVLEPSDRFRKTRPSLGNLVGQLDGHLANQVIAHK